MQEIKRSNFNLLPDLKFGYPHIKKDGKYIYKISKNSLEFLYKLKSLNYNHLNTPIDIIKVVDNYSYQYAIKSKYLKKYIEINNFNFDNYLVIEVLLFYKNLLLTLKDYHNNNIYLNDINGGNIMLNNTLDYQFIDFDLSVVKGIEFNKRTIDPAMYKYYNKLDKTYLIKKDTFDILNMFIETLYYGNLYSNCNKTILLKRLDINNYAKELLLDTFGNYNIEDIGYYIEIINIMLEDKNYENIKISENKLKRL